MEAEFSWSEVCDAHCHAHDDKESLWKIGTLQTSRLCLMGTRMEDLETVAKLASEFPDKVIPCFGKVVGSF